MGCSYQNNAMLDRWGIHSFDNGADAERKAYSVGGSCSLGGPLARKVRHLLVGSVEPCNTLTRIGSGREVDDRLEELWGFKLDTVDVPVDLRFQHVLLQLHVLTDAA